MRVELVASIADLKDNQTKQGTDLMGRLDRLQDEQTKQRTEMGAVIELLRDSAPAQLLVQRFHETVHIANAAASSREGSGDCAP